MSKKNNDLSRDWNYEYGIFAKLRGVSGSMWNEILSTIERKV